jgi:hypothetical protein
LKMKKVWTKFCYTGWPKESVNIWPLLQWNKGQILTIFLGHPVVAYSENCNLSKIIFYTFFSHFRTKINISKKYV